MPALTPEPVDVGARADGGHVTYLTGQEMESVSPAGQLYLGSSTSLMGRERLYGATINLDFL